MKKHTSEDIRPRQFVVMWDMHGLESVIPVPNPADRTFALLKGISAPEVPNIMHLELRARYNSQRHYEIYILTVDASIDQDDIRDMFEDSPQTAADIVRSKGHCYYSDRKDYNKVAIR
jgi:hypothetical protein